MTEATERPLGLWRALVADPKHGPLPALLLVMTATTGVVDAVSILSLGRVFVANMTGNVVFTGFALVGAHGFSLATSLFALAGFILGALGGGLAVRRLHLNRAVLLRNSIGVELSLVVIALILAIIVGAPIRSGAADAIAAVIAVAWGLQNALVRRLAVPDLTTTVLTMTLTGIAADSPVGNHRVIARRVLAVLTMLTGAVCGALLVLYASPSAALGLAVFLLAVVQAVTVLAARSSADWQN